MNERVKTLGWPVGLGLMWVVACWVTGMSPMGELSFLLIETIIAGVVVAIWRRSWILLTMVMALNPLSVYFAGGVIAYWGGTPSLWSLGLPRIESFNIDPKTRCFPAPTGCFIYGNEWVDLDPHNAAVRMMQHFFGPPSRSYDGPYPTKEEAAHLVAEAAVTPLPEFLEGKIRVEGEIFELDSKMVVQLGEGLQLFRLKDFPDDEHEAKVQAAWYQGRCLILRLFVEEIDSKKNRSVESDVLVFFDKKTKRPFAYFNASGGHITRFPPVGYVPEKDWK